MAAVLEWSPAVDPSDFVVRVREALAAGSFVVIPGDCGYVVLARPASPHLTLLHDSPANLLAYQPIAGTPLVARRLMYRAWPAPLVVRIGEQRYRFPDHIVSEAVYPA